MTHKMPVERCRDLVGRLVTTRWEIHTRGGQTIPAGTILQIYGTWRGLYHLESPPGSGDRYHVRQMGRKSFVLIDP